MNTWLQRRPGSGEALNAPRIVTRQRPGSELREKRGLRVLVSVWRGPGSGTWDERRVMRVWWVSILWRTEEHSPVCISLSLAQAPTSCSLLPSCCSAHSTLVTGQTRISGPEREREMGTRTPPHSQMTWTSHNRAGAGPRRERENWEESSHSFFLRPRNFQFSFLLLPQNLASSFLSFIATQTQNSQQGEETGGGFAKFYRIKPQRRLNWLCINLHHVIMAQARKNQVVSHEIKWYKSLKENFLGVCDIISCGG